MRDYSIKGYRMNGADYDTELFTELARASTMTQRQRINAELMPTDTGDTRTGTGLDGRALELVSAILAIDGELYTDGECLDVIGRIVDAWRGIQL